MLIHPQMCFSLAEDRVEGERTQVHLTRAFDFETIIRPNGAVGVNLQENIVERRGMYSGELGVDEDRVRFPQILHENFTIERNVVLAWTIRQCSRLVVRTKRDLQYLIVSERFVKPHFGDGKVDLEVGCLVVD